MASMFREGRWGARWCEAFCGNVGAGEGGEDAKNSEKGTHSDWGISALNWKGTGKFLWRPDFRPRLTEWVADFALAGKAAPGRPGLGFAHGAVPALLFGAGTV
jgi:hypothetical protein